MKKSTYYSEPISKALSWHSSCSYVMEYLSQLPVNCSVRSETATGGLCFQDNDSFV